MDLGFDPEDEGQSRKGLKRGRDRITYVFLSIVSCPVCRCVLFHLVKKCGNAGCAVLLGW